MSISMRLAAAVMASSLSLATPALCEGPDGLRVSGPSIHQNVAVFLVHGTSDGRPVPLTLQDAVPEQQARVTETGTVNELTIENLSDQEIFVQAGEIVTGGKQDRVISSNLILPPHSGRISMAAFCVEPGRWVAHEDQDGHSFTVASRSMPTSGAGRVMIAAASGRSAATRAAQSQVWEDGRRTLGSLSRQLRTEPSTSTSLAPTLESGLLEQTAGQFREILAPPGLDAQDVVGYVFAINGHIVSGEIFASNALLRKLWPKLAHGAVVDAIAARPENVGAAVPSPDEITRFLAPPRAAGVVGQRLTEYTTQKVFRDDARFLIETTRADGSWVAKMYQAK
jgi:hypothetical protein